MNLGIIVLGQIRTFFDYVTPHFTEMINNSKKKYTKIVLFLVINDKIDYDKFNLYFKTLNIEYIIIDYTKYHSIYYQKQEVRIQNSLYQKNKNNYLKINNTATNEILNPDTYNIMQFHQLEIGIDSILNYETLNNLKFNIIMKTRFDMPYFNGFYPHEKEPKDTVENKILFDTYNKIPYYKTLQQYNIEPSFENVVKLLKTINISHPKCRIEESLVSISFGGTYFYNYVSLENILSGNNNILYAFNDFVFFANRDLFVKLKYMFDNYGICNIPYNIPHYYAPESQLLIYCLYNNINILTYTHLYGIYAPIRKTHKQ